MFLLSSLPSYSWPQTIVKGYKNCASCHTASAGAISSVVNDYGRAMSADWMSTWSSPSDENEFFFDSSKYVDLRINYRHLMIPDEINGGFVNFPMLLDGQLAVHVNNYLSGEIGVGMYGRDRKIESRLSFINLKIAKKFFIRAGYFMPTFGLGFNDHSLSIKKYTGLSRGQESYNIELFSGYYNFDIFYTASAPGFKFNSYENQYLLLTEEERRNHWLRIGYNGIYRTVIGLNYKKEFVNDIIGAYFKTAPFYQPWYFMGEYDHFRLTRNSVAYARLGFYKIGIDGFLEYDQFSDKFSTDRKLFIGIDWMFRPHFQLGIKVDVLNGFKLQSQWFSWL